jgi:CCR4-NOT transcription complex subunit 4
MCVNIYICCRLLNEMNLEKKVKNQKAKSKSSDGRKQLSSVRVIQRNLVYIVGLPLDLADEDVNFLPPPLFDYFSFTSFSIRSFRSAVLRESLIISAFLQLLQKREYFGQYGKVLKVSMSRTAAGVIQQFPNETCSV